MTLLSNSMYHFAISLLYKPSLSSLIIKVWSIPTSIQQQFKDYKEALQGEGLDVDVIDSSMNAKYDHMFIQVGVSYNGINDCQYEEVTSNGTTINKMTTGTCTITFDITSFQITELKSTIVGFSVIQSTKDAIHEMLSKGVFIPSQQLDYATFPIAPSSLGSKSRIHS